MVGIKEHFIVTNIKILHFNYLLSCFLGGIGGIFILFVTRHCLNLKTLLNQLYTNTLIKTVFIYYKNINSQI